MKVKHSKQERNLKRERDMRVEVRRDKLNKFWCSKEQFLTIRDELLFIVKFFLANFLSLRYEIFVAV